MIFGKLLVQILLALYQLDKLLPTIITNVVSLRTKMGEHYIHKQSILTHKLRQNYLKNLPHLDETPQAYADLIIIYAQLYLHCK